MATYSELLAKVEDWSNRTDTTAVNGDFLDITMKRINNVLRIPPMEQLTTISIAEDTDTIAVPADMIEVIYIRTIDSDGKTVRLFNNKADPRAFAEQSQPYYAGVIYSDYTYTRVGGNYRFNCPIEKGHTLELYYYRVLPELNATYDVGTCSVATDPVTGPKVSCTGTFTKTGTEETPHWFRDEQDEILIYGALVELFNYLGENEDAAKWDRKFLNKIDELMKEENMRKYMGGTVVANIITNGLI